MVTIPKSEPYIQALNKDWYCPFVQEVSMLRLDVIHPVVSGNKWYKLKENVHQAIKYEYKGILTFGGAYSNHLVAAAATANEYGLQSIGIIRGKYASNNLSPTLESCVAYGMKLIFVSKEDYAQRADEQWLTFLLNEYPGYFVIPEGGANKWGRDGAKAIAAYIPQGYTDICISVGTGTSYIGIVNALPPEQQVYGYIPMKGGNYMKDIITPFIDKDQSIAPALFDKWHFGGFGKWSKELTDFMNSFYDINKIPLDMVYTAKMMYGIQEQIRQGTFPFQSKILCIHSGGLQGNASIAHLLTY